MRRASSLDLAGLDSLVQLSLQHSLAPSTRRSYGSAQARYLSFCHSFNFPCLPLDEGVLCRFAAWLAHEQVAHASIKGYLSALRNFQITLCGSDPHIKGMVVLQMALRGIKRLQATQGSNKPRPRLPITGEVMLALKHSWELQGTGWRTSML